MRRDFFPLLALVLMLTWHHAPLLSPDAQLTATVLLCLLLATFVGGMLALALLAWWHEHSPWAFWCVAVFVTVAVNQRAANVGSPSGAVLVGFDVLMCWLLLEWLPPKPLWLTDAAVRLRRALGLAGG